MARTPPVARCLSASPQYGTRRTSPPRALCDGSRGLCPSQPVQAAHKGERRTPGPHGRGRK
eukprot:1373080-Prorocentrum_lima.AAC.1